MVRICTVGKDGYPHCVAVNYVYQDGVILIGTASSTRWARNIIGANSKKVSFEIDVYEEREHGSFDWRGILVQGITEIISEDSERAKKVG